MQCKVKLYANWWLLISIYLNTYLGHIYKQIHVEKQSELNTKCIRATFIHPFNVFFSVTSHYPNEYTNKQANKPTEHTHTLTHSHTSIKQTLKRFNGNFSLSSRTGAVRFGACVQACNKKINKNFRKKKLVTETKNRK